MPNDDAADESVRWAEAWLGAVADGALTVSQRRLASVESRAGGVEAVRAIAERRGVHLAVIVDDRGDELVVASPHPIRVIC